MKQCKALLLVFLLPFFLFFAGALTVSAADSQEALLTQAEESLNISVFHEPESQRLIKCFDTNETRSYAIGFNNNTIHVYDSLGTFLLGYRFDTAGTYGISLKEDHIVIYLGRSNLAVEIDSAGKCVSAEKVYFSQSVTKNVMYRTCKQIGNADYSLERDIGIFNGMYSRLVRIDDTGSETILYDATARGYFSGAFQYIVLGFFPVAGIVFIAAKVRKEQRPPNSQPPSP